LQGFASSAESALYLVDREWGRYLCPLYRDDSTFIVKNGSRRASQSRKSYLDQPISLYKSMLAAVLACTVLAFARLEVVRGRRGGVAAASTGQE
jgi:hypothetical protein